MDVDKKIFESIGFILAVIIFLFSFLLFYSDNGMLFGSLAAALMAALLSWATYIIVRWLILAFR